MELSHRFSVPTPVEETWAHFQDIASVAECFPGAQVSSAEGDSFSGSVKVKLGPIALVYNGSGTFVEKDEVAHRFVVDAKGKDKRGNGTAGATVTLAMATSSTGGTDVSVDTDLAVTGKPAQFGRGVMQDVSDKLLGQFVGCLEQRLGPKVSDLPDAAPAAPLSGTSETLADRREPLTPTDPAPASAPDAGAGSAQRFGTPPPARADGALDLGSTVLPILLKSYWKQGLGVLGVIALVLVRRSRRRRSVDR